MHFTRFFSTLLVERRCATIANAIVFVGFTPNGTHFEPQRASVRAGRQKITRKSDPHASALRLKIYKVSANWFYASGTATDSYINRLIANRRLLLGGQGQLDARRPMSACPT